MNARDGHAVLVGDLAIAPLETDVWGHKQLLGVVSHTPVEVERLNALQAAGPWVDVMRPLRAAAGKIVHTVELSLARLDRERPR